ncbi:MAG: PAS domain S-box protein [Anaerolineae bacterium]|nr:PAS domain S-box protein [Anaerolineae bacterium]
MAVRVLVAEDEATLAMNTEHKLQALGYNVVAVTAMGEEAVHLAVETRPDLILLDIKLKGKLDGVETAAQIRQRFDIPVIYLTAYADAETIHRAKITAPFGYLLKPFAKEELHAAIETALYRHGLEKKLRESEELYKTMAETSPDAVMVIDLAGNITYASPHILDLHGFDTLEEVYGQNIFDFIASEDRKRAMANLQKTIQEGTTKNIEYTLLRQDGVCFPGEISATLIKEASGKPFALMTVTRDISERKQIEEALQENFQQLKIAYEQARIYAQELTQEISERKQAQAEIQKLNTELEQRVVGRTRELSALYDVSAAASESLDLKTILEQSLARLLAAMEANAGAIHLLEEDPLAGETLRLAVEQGIPGLMGRLDSPTGDSGLGSWIIEHGEPLVVSDVTADARVPLAIRQSNFKAYAGVPMRARGRVLGVTSVLGPAGHQFNVEEVALLASIADQVGVAVENARLRWQAEQAAVMEERARLARELHDSVTQLLYSLNLLAGAGQRLAKEGNLENVETYMTDLGDIAQQALKEMRLLVYELRPPTLTQEGLVGALQQRLDAVEERAGVKTRLLVAGVELLPAIVEESLYRIAQEALNNALKHASANSVVVQLQAEDGLVTLEVADDGQGFNPDAVGDRGGMGLMSMQERVERLGGFLTVVSNPGEGTTVKVRVKMNQSMEESL